MLHRKLSFDILNSFKFYGFYSNLWKLDITNLYDNINYHLLCLQNPSIFRTVRNVGVFVFGRVDEIYI